MITLLFCVMTIGMAQENNLEPVPEIMTSLATQFFTDFDARQPGMQNYRPLLANTVRLAFHSCAGSTGCCGHVNLDEPNNSGLNMSVEYLDQFMDDWIANGFSRADLYAYASQIATGMALGDNNLDTILETVEMDRTDCESIPEVGEVGFPSAHESPFEYMNTHFGFSDRETVAIMGAHNIGRATPEASGFDGFWVPNPLSLDNEFFDRISDNPWEQELANVVNEIELHAWEQNRQGPDLIALNSDMFLVRNFNILASGRVANNGCRNNFNNCMDASTLNDVEFFRDNNDAFQEEFRQVYARMLRSAGDGLEQELTSLCDRFDCSTVEVEAPANNNQDSSESSDSSEEEEAAENEDEEAQEEESDSSDSNDRPGRGRGGRGGRGNGGGRGGRSGRGRRLL